MMSLLVFRVLEILRFFLLEFTKFVNVKLLLVSKIQKISAVSKIFRTHIFCFHVTLSKFID